MARRVDLSLSERRPIRFDDWRRRVFDKACDEAALLGFTPHNLRHTAASLAISVGADVKAVQRMLGHASAAMTLDIYAGILPDGSEQVGSRLDSGVPQMCHIREIDLTSEASTTSHHIP